MLMGLASPCTIALMKPQCVRFAALISVQARWFRFLKSSFLRQKSNMWIISWAKTPCTIFWFCVWLWQTTIWKQNLQSLFIMWRCEDVSISIVIRDKLHLNMIQRRFVFSSIYYPILMTVDSVNTLSKWLYVELLYRWKFQYFKILLILTTIWYYVLFVLNNFFCPPVEFCREISVRIRTE